MTISRCYTEIQQQQQKNQQQTDKNILKPKYQYSAYKSELMNTEYTGSAERQTVVGPHGEAHLEFP